MKGILKLAGFGFSESGFLAINPVAVQALIEPGLGLAEVILGNVAH